MFLKMDLKKPGMPQDPGTGGIVPPIIPNRADCAMNTIPLTLDAYRPTYTVIGGTRSRGAREGFPVSVLLLNRGPRIYRSSLLQDLTHIGFESIISMETGSDSPEIESLATRFPNVRFISFQETVSIGDRLNVGMRESVAPYVFVLWNDMRLATSTLSSRFFEKVAELDAACLVPTIADTQSVVIPSIVHPAMARQNLRMVPLTPVKDGEKTVFPFDWSGIYSREKFMLLGGFDWTIRNPYWQRLDFGLRAWLWGEELRYAQALRLRYESAPPADDVSPDLDYGRFWLKNLAPVFRGDSAVLPGVKYFSYLAKARRGPLSALEEFRAARTWINTTAFRFKQDASRLVDLWDPVH
jgi:hypothetical protein